jgi:hypothetical protein
VALAWLLDAKRLRKGLYRHHSVSWLGRNYLPALAIGGVDRDNKGMFPVDDVVDLQVREQI